MTMHGRTDQAMAQEAVAHPGDFESFLGKLSGKDRLHVERHLLACEAEGSPAHARLWRQLASTMMKLSGHAAKTIGQQAVLFYVPDGKYRMQVFALQDHRDGQIRIYTSNALADAMESGLLTGPALGNNCYRIGHSQEMLVIDTLDARTPDPEPCFKDMTGWNRMAMRITLTVTASVAQIEAAERLCALSASRWVTAAPGN